MLNGENLWVLKETNVERGKGVTVQSRLSDLLKIAHIMSFDAIAQKYVERPLAPNGRKMDLRIWLLILHWDPMQAWLWQEPYARLASKTLNFKSSDLKDPLVHLTNRCQQSKAHGSEPSLEDEEHCWTLP